jgi:hypothetical protein
VKSYWERRREEADAKKSRFTITYEASLLTLITFVISIASLGWQLFNYFQGAQIRLISPDQIVIGSSEKVDFHSRDQGSYAHFIVRMSYVNAGATGYNATIRGERIKVTIDGAPVFEHRWYRFVAHDAQGPAGADLKVDKVSDARAFPIMAGNAESHATLFQPWPKQCAQDAKNCDRRESYLTWTKFLDLLKAKLTLDVEIISEAFGRSAPVHSRCKIEMDQGSFEAMQKNGWGSPVCR